MPAAFHENRGLSPELIDRVGTLQKGEITEYHIYRNLASLVNDPHNRSVLLQLADEEFGHYAFWKKYTRRDIGPDRVKVEFYSLVARLFGLTFGIKLMENRESEAVETYRAISVYIPEAAGILRHEEEHEVRIIGLGSLAGFTLAFQNTRLVAATGLIMGIAASLSMGASEYLSRKSEGSETNPFTAALYTGGAYGVTVILLVLPFLLMSDPLMAYAITLAMALLIIVLFTFYTSVAKDLPFLKRFTEMAVISLGIAGISFVIGILVRIYLGVEV